MRKLPIPTVEKLKRKIHSKYGKNQLGFKMILSRSGASPLANKHHFEHVGTGINNITDADISITHDRLHDISCDAWFAVVSGGICSLYFSEYRSDIKKHKFFKVEELGPAVACAIGHDGELITTSEFKEVIVTDNKPLVFWIGLDGSLNCKNMNTGAVEILVSSGCTDVCCINATRNKEDSLDYGFLVTYISGGTVWIKQLVDGVWLTEKAVPLPDNTYISVSIVRTWDYRVIVSATDTTGRNLRIYSNYQGLGKRLKEKVEVKATLNQAVYPKNPPVMIHAKNVPHGNNYGKIIQIIFDMPLHSNDIDLDLFTITDGILSQKPESAIILNNCVTLTFFDFNRMKGDITVSYENDDDPYYHECPYIYNTNFIALRDGDITFTPIGLVDPNPFQIENINVSASLDENIRYKQVITTRKIENVDISANLTNDIKYKVYSKCRNIENIQVNATLNYTLYNISDI